MYGRKIRLVTTQNTYLSISGFEAWTAGAPRSSTRTTRRTSSTRRSFGGPMQIRTTNTQVKFSNAKQSSPYGNNQFPATNAFSNGPKFTHTNKGVGMWWSVSFQGGP
jgi:hypothetical protein